MAKDGLYARVVALIKAFCSNCKSLWQLLSLAIGTVLSAFGDLYKVKSEEMPLYIAISFAVISLGLLGIILSKPASEIYRPTDGDEKDSPTLVRIFIGTVLIAVMAGCTTYADQDDQGGWLAEHSSFFASLQSNLTSVKENTDKLVVSSDQIASNTDQLLALQKESIKSEARRYLKDKRIDFTAENYARKLASGDTAIVADFYKGGMAPGIILPDGTAPIFTTILKRTPNYPNILQQAINHGFDPNAKLPLNFTAQLGADPAGLAAAMFPQNGPLLEGLASESIQDGRTEFSLGDFLPLLFFGPNSESNAFKEKYGIDMTGGVELRENFTAIVDKIAKRNLKNFNSWGLYEKDLNERFNNLRGCSGLEEMTEEQFRPNPYGKGGIPHPERLFALIEKACKSGALPNKTNASEEEIHKFVNSRIDQANAQYSRFQETFGKKRSDLHLDEFRSTLEIYKDGTRAFKGE